MNTDDLNAHIFDVQSFSVHDGPGHRTTVFFSGCPLNCWWCSNPEGRDVSQKKKLFYNENRCVSCLRCVEACQQKAISLTAFSESHRLQINIDRELCKNCESNNCSLVCYHEGLRLSGKIISLSDLKKRLTRDRKFWGSDSCDNDDGHYGEEGGVTFSGGEPLMQSPFLIKILSWCQEVGIHTAIETSAHVESQKFLSVMSKIDWAFIDIKHLDPIRHLKATGVSNKLILQNIQQLMADDMSKSRPRDIVVRMPFIPGFNDDIDHAHLMSHFLFSNKISAIHLLPLHIWGKSKYLQLGLKNPYPDLDASSSESFIQSKKNWEDIMLNKNIKCYWSDNTPF